MHIAKLSVLVLNVVLFLLFSCGNDKPQLSKKHMEWKIFNRSVNTNDPTYPLEVLEDGYKMIKAYRVEASKIRDIEFPASNKVDWGWKCTVRNNSNKGLRITVKYILKDNDLFDIVSDSESEFADPNETITIRSISSMSYDDINRVSYSSWEISY